LLVIVRTGSGFRIESVDGIGWLYFSYTKMKKKGRYKARRRKVVTAEALGLYRLAPREATSQSCDLQPALLAAAVTVINSYKSYDLLEF
jgi:hypothetical protein